MTNEQYERAEAIQSKIKKLKKAVVHLRYDSAFVEVHVPGCAGCDELRDKGIINYMADYLSCRIATLETEFEKL